MKTGDTIVDGTDSGTNTISITTAVPWSSEHADPIIGIMDLQQHSKLIFGVAFDQVRIHPDDLRMAEDANMSKARTEISSFAAVTQCVFHIDKSQTRGIISFTPASKHRSQLKLHGKPCGADYRIWLRID